MVFDAVAFVNLSDDLLENLSGAAVRGSDSDQAKVRTSISRAYYGAYLSARQHVARLGAVTLTGGPRDHQLVKDSLAEETAKKLEELRTKRNRADYNLNARGFTLSSGRYWTHLARQILTELQGS